MGHVLCWGKVLTRSQLTYNAPDTVLGAGGGASLQWKIQVHLQRRILCMEPLDLIILAFISEHLCPGEKQDRMAPALTLR